MRVVIASSVGDTTPLRKSRSTGVGPVLVDAVAASVDTLVGTGIESDSAKRRRLIDLPVFPMAQAGRCGEMR